MSSLFKQRHFFVYFITLLVAFCSIVYELVYSQTLTIVFGGTVQRYAITIGLFLFFLGLGSFYYKFLNSKKDFQNFIKVEIILSINSGSMIGQSPVIRTTVSGRCFLAA